MGPAEVTKGSGHLKGVKEKLAQFCARLLYEAGRETLGFPTPKPSLKKGLFCSIYYTAWAFNCMPLT